MMALIHAIAARAGWLIPKWLVKLMEDEVRGLVEAFTLLAAEGAKLLAAQAEQRAEQAAEQAGQIPAPVAEPAAQKAGGSPKRGKSARSGRQGGAASQSTRRPGKRHQRSRPRATPRRHPPSARRASGRITLALKRPPRFSAYAKPAPWHAHIVTIS
jgi:hypothetical protein